MRAANPFAILDGNEAVASVAYRLSEVIAIYPITPATAMGEQADAWAAQGHTNLWGSVPAVIEMQSEAGAAGTVHGAVQTGALATTFTASQGLLLMLPNMFKIAGELTPAVIHVASRAVATHALSIFGDHSDVMAARSTGFALLCAGSVQEAHDLAAVAHATTLRARVPVLHFFDGFRTSHEIASVAPLDDDDLRALVDEDAVLAHRARGLTPDAPVLRGTAQNPDVFFQAREAQNRHYAEFQGHLRAALARLAEITGRHYGLVDYVGSLHAQRVLVAMGSGCEVAAEAVQALVARGERVGLVRVRLFRPFPAAEFLAAMPVSVEGIAVLDRCKEPGAQGEPLYQEVVTALAEGWTGGRRPLVLGGRFGLASKEFTPAMAKAALDELGRPEARKHFTVGIDDDVTHLSLAIPTDFVLDRDPAVTRAVFVGLGSDGTVGANKNSVKIIGEHTGQRVQAYFVYDSKKAGAVTVSHLRFGDPPIHSSYLIEPGTARFVACHHPRLLRREDVVKHAAEKATLLLNVPWPRREVWARLPAHVRAAVRDKDLRVWAVDALAVARAAGLGSRISTVMQACFFRLCPILPFGEALAAIKAAIEESFGKRGEEVVARNFRAVDEAVAGLFEVVPDADADVIAATVVASEAATFERDVTLPLLAGHGDALPTSRMPVDGTFPTNTARLEKRGITDRVPVWEPDLCIECARCALVCPHAAIRIKAYDSALVAGAPDGFKTRKVKATEQRGQTMTIQLAPDDCTGCELCVHVCPAKDRTHPARKALGMADLAPIVDDERAAFRFFLDLPEADRTAVDLATVRGSQLLQPLFEFSGACAGCGETPYLKLLSQLFGDRAVIANATGCSSIYGGNLPTTPWSTNADGRGPAWSNSLFEDAAEFGLGFRLTFDQQRAEARALLEKLRPSLGDALTDELATLPHGGETALRAQREAVSRLRAALARGDGDAAMRLLSLADALTDRSVWVVGGDGWAYDIGFAGLDHVLASGRNVNVLVLDTEVYSNTGGQTSKATPRAAVAKFSAMGKPNPKKDIGMIAMAHSHVYVAQIALAANDKQAVRAFLEAESYDGPSLILAYSHCIAHGFDLARAQEHQTAAVNSGHWPLYRYDPRRLRRGENPLQLDSRKPSLPFVRFAETESRFQMLARTDPEHARRLRALAQQDIDARWHLLEQMAQIHFAKEVLP